MSLPRLIEIIPLDHSVAAEMVVPGSKSITNRTLILAALGNGETRLEGALWSEDTQVMVEALRVLGFEVEVTPDRREYCNRTIQVRGSGGRIPRAGTAQKPLELFVGNAGTAARFLAALVCLGNGVYRLHGVPRMHERPQAALFDALRGLGHEVDSANNRLPAVIRARGPLPGRCRVSIEESSQFASGLLLCAPVASWQVEVVGENAEESFYVAMTSKLIERFPRSGGSFPIEPDASSGSYFLAAGELAGPGEANSESGITVAGWPHSGLQIDERFPEVIRRAQALAAGLERVRRGSPGSTSYTGRLEPAQISRVEDLGDSIMTAIVLAPFAAGRVRFTDLGRLRLQECERVQALRTELSRCGAKVTESGDTLEIEPSELHGAEVETYGDHRMAMCFAILGLKVPGIQIKDPGCVKKTFPNFFQKLAAPPPQGLGAQILDVTTRKRLQGEELFAA